MELPKNVIRVIAINQTMGIFDKFMRWPLLMKLIPIFLFIMVAPVFMIYGLIWVVGKTCRVVWRGLKCLCGMQREHDRKVRFYQSLPIGSTLQYPEKKQYTIESFLDSIASLFKKSKTRQSEQTVPSINANRAMTPPPPPMPDYLHRRGICVD